MLGTEVRFEVSECLVHQGIHLILVTESYIGGELVIGVGRRRLRVDLYKPESITSESQPTDSSGELIGATDPFLGIMALRTCRRSSGLSSR